MGVPTLLGYDETGKPVLLSGEEHRLHLDIFGAPGQGKSKLIELLIRNNLLNGYGACLLDPGENGDTVQRLLAYCEHQGFDKICLINPIDFFRFDKVPFFNPLKYRQQSELVVGNIMDALGILWASKDFSERLGFLKVATALINIIHRTKYTLPDSKYFLSPVYVNQREEILRTIPASDLYRQQLLSSKSGQVFEAVSNRFSVFQDQYLRLMLGSKHFGINFKQLIRDGYLILVNLDPQGVWGGQVQQRLLGTLLINEITQAIHSLRDEGWSSAYYLYIDEVGDYATPKIAYILDKKRKTGLSFTIAHQRFGQIADSNILSSVRGSTSNKVLFHTLNQDDRATMIKDMGFSSQSEMLHALRRLKVQQAAITIGKAEPRIADIEPVDDHYLSPRDLVQFKKHIYNQYFYKGVETINKEINARFAKTEPTTFRRRKPVQGDFGGSSAAPVPRESDNGAETRTAADNQADGADVLPHRKGRTALQSLFDSPKKV